MIRRGGECSQAKFLPGWASATREWLSLRARIRDIRWEFPATRRQAVGVDETTSSPSSAEVISGGIAIRL